MGQFISVRYVGLAAAVIGCAALTAPAAVLLDQNFNDTSIFVPNTGITTTGVGDASTSVGLWEIPPVPGFPQNTPYPTPNQAPGKSTGDQAIQLTRTGGAATQLAGSWADGISSGSFTFQASIYRDASDSTFTFVVQQLNLGTAHTPVAFYIDSSGHLKVMNATDNGWNDTSEIIPSQTWTTFKGAVDKDHGTWSLTATIGTQSPVAVVNSATFVEADLGAVDSIRFAPQGSTGNTFWVDDVKLETVPEPASLGLLAGGLAVVVLKRRRK